MRSPIADDDPRHGSIAGSSAGCDCRACRIAKAAYKVHRERQIAYGRWAPFVDAEPVREHLRALARFGVGWQRASRLAGVAEATVSTILYGDHGRPRRRVRAETAAKLLAVPLSLDTAADGAVVDATGTVRRLRALVALGWSMDKVLAGVPVHVEAGRRLIRHGNPRCTAVVARAARRVYDELSIRVPPSGSVAKRMRTLAAGRGWVPPLAWDDETIDDSAAKPRGAGRPRAVVDEAAVLRLMRGERVKSRPVDRREAMRRLLDEGLSTAEVAVRLRVTVDAVGASLRRRRGVAA